MTNDNDDAERVTFKGFHRYTAILLANGMILGWASADKSTGEVTINTVPGAPEWMIRVQQAQPYVDMETTMGVIREGARRAAAIGRLFGKLELTENDAIMGKPSIAPRRISGVLSVGAEGVPVKLNGKRMGRSYAVQETPDNGALNLWLGNGFEMPAALDRHVLARLSILPEPTGWRIVAYEAGIYDNGTTIAFLRRGCATPREATDSQQ